LLSGAEGQLSRGEIAGAIVNFRESLKLNSQNKEAAEGLSEALTAHAIEVAGAGNNSAAIPFWKKR